MGQIIPDVRVNHLYLVIDAADLATIQMSDYVKHRLVAVETRTTRTGEGRSWIGTYLYGKDNYFELFGPDYANVGRSGIGFSVDNPGDIHALKGWLENKYKVSIFRRDRDFDGTGIPWFDSLSIDDPVFHSDSLVGFWVMEYKKEYFEYKNYSQDNGTLTAESYLSEWESDREGKVIKRFSGVVLTLSAYEMEFLMNYFRSINYLQMSENEFLSPDNFRFVLKERSPNGTRTIESLEFETTTMLDKETRGLSGNVSVVIDGDKGRLLFEDPCSLP